MNRLVALLAIGLLLLSTPASATVSTDQFGVIPPTAGSYSSMITVTGSYNFHTYDAQFGGEAENLRKWPMVRCGVNYGIGNNTPTAAAVIAGLHKGYTWIICNEPDISGQDGPTTFTALAQQIHDYTAAIRTADPSASFTGANSEVDNPTWDTSLTQAYQTAYGTVPPWDFYGVHVYVPVAQLTTSLFTYWCGTMRDLATDSISALDVTVAELGRCRVIVTEFGQNDTNPVLYVQKAVGVFRALGIPHWFVFSAGNLCGVCVTTNLLNADNTLSATGTAWTALEGIH